MVPIWTIAGLEFRATVGEIMVGFGRSRVLAFAIQMVLSFWMMCRNRFRWLVYFLVIQVGQADLGPGLATLQTNTLLQRVRVLASDEFEGRAPGTPGEEKTVLWLEGQFKAMGLNPGGANGTYFDKVPMVGVSSTAQAAFLSQNRREELVYPQDFVAWSPQTSPTVHVTNSPLVFVGYGVVAPEYGWDDFKGMDVRGKTLVMLVGDPPVRDPAHPEQLDPKVFKGKAMTYYGRWTYKYEIAAAKGAAAAIIVHETGPAGYPWFVVVNSWGHERFDLEENRGPTLQVASWMSLERTRSLFKSAGWDYEAAKAEANNRDFQPRSFGCGLECVITNQVRHIQSRNVAAALPGKDPAHRNEWVVVTAHWDHLGKDARLSGDQIFNGAEDNATGTAGLLGLAEAFIAGPRPARSILFLSVTGEEQGLLGAKFYATHPTHPLRQTVANINMDGLNTWGRTRSVAVVGLGNSSLDDDVIQVARAQGRSVTSETMPEKGTFYRSDHFEFAKAGVPALYVKNGLDYLNHPQGWGKAKSDEFTDRDYHKVTDEVKPDWDLDGAVEDLGLLYQVTWEVANRPEWPVWKSGSEFKARREAMLSGPAPSQ